MSSVKRYIGAETKAAGKARWGTYADLESPDGDFVRYSDYAALEQKLADLKAANPSAKECPRCQGGGWSGYREICPDCKGTGQSAHPQPEAPAEVCEVCGEGRLHHDHSYSHDSAYHPYRPAPRPCGNPDCVDGMVIETEYGFNDSTYDTQYPCPDCQKEKP